MPLYRLLGGSSAPLPYYVTIGPGAADHGMTLVSAADAPQAVKVAMPCAPRDGAEGMRRNVETVARLRDAIGPGVPIAVDCFMSWNLG